MFIWSVFIKNMNSMYTINTKSLTVARCVSS